MHCWYRCCEVADKGDFIVVCKLMILHCSSGCTSISFDALSGTCQLHICPSELPKACPLVQISTGAWSALHLRGVLSQTSLWTMPAVTGHSLVR